MAAYTSGTSWGALLLAAFLVLLVSPADGRRHVSGCLGRVPPLLAHLGLPFHFPRHSNLLRHLEIFPLIAFRLF